MGGYLIIGVAYLGWIGLTARVVSDVKHLMTMVLALGALCIITVQIL